MRVNRGKKFISNALKLYCQEKNIKIGYAAPYIDQKNEISEKCWRILAIIKDVLLINSRLSVNFWAKAINTLNYLQIDFP